jgi:hypothetical protein
MADNVDERLAEIKRVQADADDMAKLMNGRFVLDKSKLQAFTTNRGIERTHKESDDSLAT